MASTPRPQPTIKSRGKPPSPEKMLKTPEKLSEEERRWAIRTSAENDLETFIRLVSPKQVMGSVHSDLCSWWTRSEAKSHQLTLLPRDHQKSRMVAFRVVWEITRRPDIRVLYISSTSNLAEKQLKFMKDLLSSEVYRRYWPEMINIEEGKREKWTASEISVDHPKRKEEGVRDPTIFTGGLTTSLTGTHCDIAVLDDVVVYENAVSVEGREKVRSQYSLISSIEGAEAMEWVVGTRYHPNDLYSEMAKMDEDIYDSEGSIVGSNPIYEIYERQVESAGDGTGEFLWPRQLRSDGKWFGFDQQILAKKRGQYLDKTQFRAQYYNNPTDPNDTRISRDKFQYYDKNRITEIGGSWYYGSRKLNLYASVDFAYSTSKRADYTAICVIGVDYENNIYVLDIDRFKTDKVGVYFQHILNMHTKWGFNKIACEVTAAQKAIVNELKDSYIRPNALYLAVVEMKPTASQGSKEERLMAVLDPKYYNQSIWHYKGGNCQVLEDELIEQFPPHDDVMDALANAIVISTAPSRQRNDKEQRSNIIPFNKKFGGVSFRG